MTQERLTSPLAELTTAIEGAHTLEQVSWVAVEFARTHLASDLAGLTLHDTLRGSSETMALSGAVVAELNAVRLQLGEGPGPLGSGGVVAVPDTRNDLTWPSWSAAAATLGVRSVRLYGLPEIDGRAATLELYSHVEDTTSGPDELARDLAGVEHIGLALRMVARIAHLEEGMRTREVIGQAQGIVMERHGLTAEESMAFLRRASQQSQVKVRDLAVELTASLHSADIDQEAPGRRSPRRPR